MRGAAQLRRAHHPGRRDLGTGLALTPTLTLADSFSPARWITDNAEDLDLGSMSPAVAGERVLAVGKSGVGYLLDGARLGGIGGPHISVGALPHFASPTLAGAHAYLGTTTGIVAIAVR